MLCNAGWQYFLQPTLCGTRNQISAPWDSGFGLELQTPGFGLGLESLTVGLGLDSRHAELGLDSDSAKGGLVASLQILIRINTTLLTPDGWTAYYSRMSSTPTLNPGLPG